MGWTYTKKPSYQTPAQFIAEQSWGSQKEKLIATATVGEYVYFAFKTKPEPGSGMTKLYEVEADGSITAALVYLFDTKTQAGDPYNFGWKAMDETVGPYDEGKCPAAILKLLTPLKPGDSYARKWRERQKAWKVAA